MDPYEDERLAIEKRAFAPELRMALEEGVERGWLFVPYAGIGIVER
jgi:hypothetical protein